jgi:hypothetical protein
MAFISLPLIVGFACLIGIVWVLAKPAWMGLQGKTLWDWITVLSVPLTFGVGAALITVAQANIQEDRAREAALQLYIDRISVLMADGLSEPEIAIGRAQTGAVLRLVSQDRAGRILLFLSEIELLHNFDPNLEFVDLSGADLKGMALAGVDFEGSNLRSSELEDADLSDADLEGADLRGADLKDADVQRANFDRTLLNGADLDHADLRGAYLSGVIGAKAAQIAKACLNAETKLPPGLVVIPATGTGCEGRAEDDD